MSELLRRGKSTKTVNSGSATVAAPESYTRSAAVASAGRKPVVTSAGRFAVAFSVAVGADILVGFLPLGPIGVVCDVVTALILCAILGFNWILVPAFLAEAMPGLGIFPSWTLAVLALAGIGHAKRASQ